MRFSLDFKKSVFVKTLVILVVGLALGFVVGQSSYTLNQNDAWHPLQQVSMGSSAGMLFSVDSNNNGQIDKSDNSDKVRDIDVDTNSDGVVDKAAISDKISGSDPSSNEGCVFLDTGLGSTNGDSNMGYQALNLKISSVSGAKNICDDHDGCSYSVVKYNYNQANKAPVIMGQSSGKTLYKFFQWGQYATLPLGNWIDDSSNNGKNGDNTNTRFVNWQTGTPSVQWLELYDDSPSGTFGGENSIDQITVRDQRNDFSFIVSFCD